MSGTDQQSHQEAAGRQPEGNSAEFASANPLNMLKGFTFDINQGAVKKPAQEKQGTFTAGGVQSAKAPFEKRKDSKQKQEETEASKIFEEFMATFASPGNNKNNATKNGSSIHGNSQQELRSNFISGGLIQQGSIPPVESSKASVGNEKMGNLFAPTKRSFDAASLSAAHDAMKPSDDAADSSEEEETPIVVRRKKDRDKRTSNLEAFKEELKRKQEEREHKRSKQDSDDDIYTRKPDNSEDSGEPKEVKEKDGSFFDGDPHTTNIFLGNLNPEGISEEILCTEFGKFGPLASVKIMWPRKQEDILRGHLSGFIAFMKREDAAKALEKIQGASLLGYELRANWSKAVQIPAQPVYVYDGPGSINNPQTGLPFNAKIKPKAPGAAIPPPSTYSPFITGPNMPLSMTDPNSVLPKDCEIKVVIPSDHIVRRLIHRMIEFVVKYGPEFEQCIIDQEATGPNADKFGFLIHSTSPEHVYYRWKLFSVLQGDHRKSGWSKQPFQMVIDGPWWIPPDDGKTNETSLLKAKSSKDVMASNRSSDDRYKKRPTLLELAPDNSKRETQLSKKQKEELERIVRHLNLERGNIARVMSFAISNAYASEEIVEYILDSLSLIETPVNIKIARFYVISDILYNTTVSVPNVSSYKRLFESKLPMIMAKLSQTYRAILGRLRAEQFKNSIFNVLKIWEGWSLLPRTTITALRTAFIGQSDKKPIVAVPAVVPSAAPTSTLRTSDVDDIDGEPIDDIDGIPIE